MTEQSTLARRPISQLDWPTPEQLRAARRERGLFLRAMIAGLARKVSCAFTNGPKQPDRLAARSPAARRA